ncbi:MAG: ribbon-helix-helix domain-containing protein, partial [Bacteroidetes bacterium]|nr:ribbon-helix-helix domain-containing protein [Bacteroidota bacterium]
MITFTSSLPDDLLQSLNTLSGKLSIPKNKIIEKALR